MIYFLPPPRPRRQPRRAARLGPGEVCRARRWRLLLLLLPARYFISRRERGVAPPTRSGLRAERAREPRPPARCCFLLLRAGGGGGLARLPRPKKDPAEGRRVAGASSLPRATFAGAARRRRDGKRRWGAGGGPEAASRPLAPPLRPPGEDGAEVAESERGGAGRLLRAGGPGSATKPQRQPGQVCRVLEEAKLPPRLRQARRAALAAAAGKCCPEPRPARGSGARAGGTRRGTRRLAAARLPSGPELLGALWGWAGRGRTGPPSASRSDESGASSRLPGPVHSASGSLSLLAPPHGPPGANFPAVSRFLGPGEGCSCGLQVSAGRKSHVQDGKFSLPLREKESAPNSAERSEIHLLLLA
ncbi:Hypothetical predicted protein [Podarcis lilfordi]|uniref:Uncharacterized protein n=1 Tax=Podarcis lilfordi TaxID=74358 RepID=A0AA35KYX8_9SAUR|nr:Hypothetical predicted protein [Podarcis lilfordi]